MEYSETSSDTLVVERRFFEMCSNIANEIKTKSSFSDDPDKPMSVEEASEFLNLAAQTIYGYTSRNEIPHTKRGKKLYFYKKELTDWLKKDKKSFASEEKTKKSF